MFYTWDEINFVLHWTWIFSKYLVIKLLRNYREKTMFNFGFVDKKNIRIGHELTSQDYIFEKR